MDRGFTICEAFSTFGRGSPSLMARLRLCFRDDLVADLKIQTLRFGAPHLDGSDAHSGAASCRMEVSGASASWLAVPTSPGRAACSLCAQGAWLGSVESDRGRSLDWIPGGRAYSLLFPPILFFSPPSRAFKRYQL